MKKAFLASILFIGIEVFAVTPKSFDLAVVAGSNKTVFRFETLKGKQSLTKVSQGHKKTVKLTDKDAAYLETKFREIMNMKSHDRSLCYTSLIAVGSEGGSMKRPIIACIQSPLPVAQKSIRLANLLNLTAKLKK